MSIWARRTTTPWAKTRDSPKGCGQNRRRTAAWSRDRRNAKQGPRSRGCDRGADHKRVDSKPILRASAGSDPQRGPSSALRRAPLAGMRPRRWEPVAWIRCAERRAPGSHPSKKRLEPAPPSTRRVVGQRWQYPDIATVVLLTFIRFWPQRTRVSSCYALSDALGTKSISGLPVISAGCASPIILSNVGATSCSAPPPATLALRPT